MPVVQADRYVYLRTTRPERVHEPWSAYTFLFPRSPSHLESLDPVVRLRPDGLGGQIGLSLVPGSTTCVRQRIVGVHPTRSGDELDPGGLVSRFYE